jgi:hypothetical protein
MGLLDSLKSWLFGNDPRKTMRKAKVRLKLFVNRLDRQRAKMEAQAAAAKKKAIEARKKGDNETAANYAKSYLQFAGWARGVEKFKLQLDALLYKVESSSNMVELNDTMMQVGKALQGLSQLKLPNMDELLSNIDMNLEEFNLMFETTGESMEMMDSTEDQAITDTQVNDVLSEIDSEIMIETTDQLPTAQGTKVSGLQDELERLRDKK